jgi:hypothetical protein
VILQTLSGDATKPIARNAFRDLYTGIAFGDFALSVYRTATNRTGIEYPVQMCRKGSAAF